MKTRTRRQFEDLPVEAREQFAENTKERIYSTITLLALATALWHSAAHHSHSGVLAAIIGSVVALWLATLMADQMSYRAVHGKNIPASKYRTMFFSATGLLAPAVVPALLVVCSWAGMFSLEIALVMTVVALLMSIVFFSFLGNRRIYDTPFKVLGFSFVELCIGFGVVALKLLAGE